MRLIVKRRLQPWQTNLPHFSTFSIMMKILISNILYPNTQISTAFSFPHLLISFDTMGIFMMICFYHSMGTQAFCERLNSSLTPFTSLLDFSILPLLSSWISMCSFTTSDRALNSTMFSPSCRNSLSGRKALVIPVSSPRTHLNLAPTLWAETT